MPSFAGRFAFSSRGICIFGIQPSHETQTLDTANAAGILVRWSTKNLGVSPMNSDSHDISPVFRIDVTQSASESQLNHSTQDTQSEMVALMHQLVMGQDRQNELLEEIVDQMGAQQRQRSSELGQWKEANPLLARRCRAAAEALSKIQTEFLHGLTVEVNDNHEDMADSDYMLNEFVDRYGPRLAHMNGVLQLLSQLGSAQPQPVEAE